jgi:hypothetical protein
MAGEDARSSLSRSHSPHDKSTKSLVDDSNRPHWSYVHSALSE